MRSMAINSGAIVGPALGAALYHIFSFHIILYISIGTYAILGTILTLIYFHHRSLLLMRIVTTK